MGLSAAIDITADQRKTILALLERYLPNTTVWVYGSRAKWTSRPQSDLDMVVFATPEQNRRVSDLREAFEESSLPFRVYLFVWDDVPESFRKHVKAGYVVLVKKEKRSVRSGWRTVTLGDVIDLRLSSVDKKTKDNEHAVQLCNYMDVYNNSFIFADMDFMTATATEREISNCSLTVGDVVITKDSEKYDDIGVPALVREDIPDLVCGYHLAILRPDSQKLDGMFLFYALNAVEVQQQFHSYANGVTRFGLRKADIGLVEIPLPPLSEQRAIAHILGKLDDKIELNRRMNETLEEIARVLFKSWFIDFDPVRAKMEGRDPGLPKHLADLFPDRLVDSELGPIPEGWEAGVLDDAIELLSGGTPRTSETSYWNGDIPWYTAKDAPSLSDIFVLDTERTITQAGVENSSTKILPFGTTIITARGTVGRLACLGMPMAMNQTCYGIRGARGYPDFFTYWTIRKAVDELQSRTHGTIFDTITRQTFKIVDMVLPPVNVAEAFERTVNPIMEHILNNLNESRTLAAQRDALLPKLVSGKLRLDRGQRC